MYYLIITYNDNNMISFPDLKPAKLKQVISLWLGNPNVKEIRVLNQQPRSNEIL